MNLFTLSTRFVAAAAIATAVSTSASAQVELAVNGDFETGDTTGWQVFGAPPATFDAVSGAGSEGLFGGILSNTTEAQGPVIKQANVGAGLLTPFETIEVSFDAKGTAANGGVFNAVVFSELSGGGVSATENLSLAGLNDTTFTSFFYSFALGADVSGGATLQLGAITGGDIGSTSILTLDNVSIRTIPEPTSAALIGLSSLGLLARRRRQA